MDKESKFTKLNELCEAEEIEMEVTAKLPKDIKASLQAVDDIKILKYVVDQYYQAQGYRMRAANQLRALLSGVDESEKEHLGFLQLQLDNAYNQEKLNKKYMEQIVSNFPLAKWLLSIKGVSYVTAAIILSKFDVTKGSYATDFMSYAGLNDNNNPWLGTEGAREVVSEAKAYNKEVTERAHEALSEYISLFTNDKKMVRVIYDTVSENIGTSNIYNIGHSLTDAIKEAIKHDDIVNEQVWFDENYPGLYSMIPDIIMEKIRPGWISEIVYQYCSTKTTRKVSLIKKGTNKVYESRKDNKKNYLTLGMLESYLAKPPYNKPLKSKMFLIGNSFVKQSNRGSLYGQIYKEKYASEMIKNERGDFKDQAAVILKKCSKGTAPYKSALEGKLCNGHIMQRAKRYAVKIFISHVYEAMYYEKFHQEAPKYYVFEHDGHHDYIAPEVDYRDFL